VADRSRPGVDAETIALSASVAAACLVMVLDALSPGSNYSSLFLFLPLIASTGTGPRRTAVVGVVATALGALFLAIDEATATEATVRIIGLAVGSALTVALSNNRTRRERRLDDLDRFATIAQSLIIRPVPARLANVGAAGRYVSASDVLAVGGDLYDVALTPGGVRFIIGDACGKGLGGIRLAAEVLTAFREAVFAEPDLEALARILDQHVVAVCRREGHDLDFVTAVIGDLADDGELRIASCGHPDGLLIGPDGPLVLRPVERACPLGLGAAPAVTTYQVGVGDRLVWWTDGASEARDAAGEYLDIERVVAAEARGPDLGDTLDALVDVVRAHVAGDVRDDVALLALQRMAPVETGSWPGAGRR
jgi:sigma-B regulation protein RsbU (phosphoserine phosphatase)